LIVGGFISKKTLFGLLLIASLLTAIFWSIVARNRSRLPGQLRGTGETLTVAATGDWLRSEPINHADSAFAGVGEIVNAASMGLTNLEVNLLNPKDVPPAEVPGTFRWPYGTFVQAEDLRKLGLNVISLANNRSMAYGPDGMKQTQHILDSVGLLHVGSGMDLQTARLPASIGVAPRHIAVVAVTTSASPEARATDSKGEILGRSGVSAIRYSPDVTVDSATFATLKNLPTATANEPGGDPGRLVLSGMLIKRGAKTVVKFSPEERDVQSVLEQVKRARSTHDVVIVMMHSHEPSNHSQTPAEFVQTIAHALIDAGASLIIGSGPHQLRGVEVYNGGAILYSLGNFSADYKIIGSRASDVYDSNFDLYQFAMGAAVGRQENPPSQFLEPIWWESVIATATYEQGKVKSLRLLPIDLGADLAPSQRGLPRIAALDRGTAILQRLEFLSEQLGTRIRIENGIGIVEVSH
jgi:poly-gamma-glutamate capsule biosynthesis protein CapA/YwtB (metallophosphatase superfamily)